MLFYLEEDSVGFHLDRFDEELLYNRELGKSWQEIIHEKSIGTTGNIQEIDALIKTVLLLSILEQDLKRSRINIDISPSMRSNILSSDDTLGGWNL